MIYDFDATQSGSVTEQKEAPREPTTRCIYSEKAPQH